MGLLTAPPSSLLHFCPPGRSRAEGGGREIQEGAYLSGREAFQGTRLGAEGGRERNGRMEREGGRERGRERGRE